MNDPKREQLPLLCDDLSDDEYQIEDSNQIHQRRLFSPNNARSKYKVKGAAAIIKQWPDHMSSLLTYWWMGLAMIALIVFIIYNSVVAIAIIPPQSKLNKMQAKLDHKALEYSASYKTIYMHIIVNNNLDLDLNNYLPYIEIIAKTYPTFKYNLVVLFNDTLNNTDDKENDFQKNEVALSSLWKEKYVEPIVIPAENIFIQRKSLTAVMNASPLKKYWRHLPNKFMDFLIRCIAIWNKGGISINPLLLTPKSPHPDYMDEIKNILKSVESPKLIKHKKDFYKAFAPKMKLKKRVNNIRDIINELETNNSSTEQSKSINLVEEDTKNVPEKIIINNTRIESLNVMEDNSASLKNVRKTHHMQHKLDIDLNNHSGRIKGQKFGNETNDYNLRQKNNTITNKDSTTEQKLLPMFLKYLFSPTTDANILYKPEHSQDFAENIKNSNEHVSNSYAIHDKYLSKEGNNFISSEFDQFLDLNLDLKGNIVATKTPCHAFLGTIFNNVIHHIKDETVTDLIISELSFFCKGTWTSCKGVNVIFL